MADETNEAEQLAAMLQAGDERAALAALVQLGDARAADERAGGPVWARFCDFCWQTGQTPGSELLEWWVQHVATDTQGRTEQLAAARSAAEARA